MTEICILNAHRSCVIVNLTLDAIYKNTFKEDIFILSVKQHKTYGSPGSAKIILQEKFYQMLATYVQGREFPMSAIVYHFISRCQIKCSGSR